MGLVVADFETSVYDGQSETEVWVAGIQTSLTEQHIVSSIDAFMNLCFLMLESGTKVFFHNVKFDGSFIIPWLINNNYKLAYNEKTKTFDKRNEMPRKSFECHINRKGIWYSITVKTSQRKVITFVDSYKLLPFSLADAAKAFGLSVQKKTMVYKGERHSGHVLTEVEREYFKADLQILYECMQHIIKLGDKLTIGSICLHNYKNLIGKQRFNELFPDVYNIPFENIPCTSQFSSIGKYILRSYNGAFVLIKSGCENKVFKNGITIDATSLYPSVMHSSSGFLYPIGKGEIVKGKIQKQKGKYFYQRICCTFKVKPNYLPFIRIRGNPLYSPRVIQYTTEYESCNLTFNDPVELTLTMYELDLFFKHYDVSNLTYIDGIVFDSAIGLFDDYIDYWKEKKDNAKSKVDRTISKLYLNNLYGKFAAVPDSSFFVPKLVDGVLKFDYVEEEKAKPGYIPIGAAITSHARIIDISAAQANYENFIYTDTDSLHLTCSESEVKGVRIHENDLGTFKVEARWSEGIFNNVKRYIEHTENGYEITCAGMVKRGKKVLALRLEGDVSRETLDKYGVDELSYEELEYIKQPMKLTDFQSGLIVPNGKTKAKKIKGGTVIYDGDFTIL